MQRPHRRPPPRSVIHRPRRQPLSLSALTATQNLGRTPHQPQRQRGPLHNALIHPRTLGQRRIRRPAMPARAALGEPGPRIRHLKHIDARDPVTGHQMPNPLIAQVISDRHLNTSPTLRTRPQRHIPIRIPTARKRQPRTPPRRIGNNTRQPRQLKLASTTQLGAPHMRPRRHHSDRHTRPRAPRHSSTELLHKRHTTTRTIPRTTPQTRLPTPTTRTRRTAPHYTVLTTLNTMHTTAQTKI
ncbi:Uncharacterised protein [Mycobacteroides abscessus subsp. massiliense]|nr:Uncharacterised protein [Mycobacteroides abscessus subsp. massiliense]SKW11721.1 Uncharacterised protein [Mycobacteroides abscessus subsp. massiliense]SKW46816.1 Uncharacterised protein [Mycobacteroides abscessus subsp. massiliense]